MSAIYIVLPLALLAAAAAVIAFIWSVRSGQFDDLETPGARVLFDDEDDEDRPDARSRSGGAAARR